MFKIGSYYSRKDVGFVLHPKEGRPAGGNWDTGYVTVQDKLIVFMNMGVPGKTGHNYNNSYDDEKKEITWYGKTKSHSGTDTFKKLFCPGEVSIEKYLFLITFFLFFLNSFREFADLPFILLTRVYGSIIPS